MNHYPYIGDRQLEPDDEWECPHCGLPFSNAYALKAHAARCAENDDIDYPDDEQLAR